jgi:hypothetical protein
MAGGCYGWLAVSGDGIYVLLPGKTTAKYEYSWWTFKLQEKL